MRLAEESDWSALPYEPNPRTRSVVEKNFHLNGLTPQLRSRAVNINGGTAKFYFAENIYSSSLYDRDLGGETEVPCDAMQDVLDEFNPNVIVMDVEGAEVDLLPESDLNSLSKLIVELHPEIVGEDRIQKLLELLAQQGFTLVERLGRSYYFSR